MIRPLNDPVDITFGSQRHRWLLLQPRPRTMNERQALLEHVRANTAFFHSPLDQSSWVQGARDWLVLPALCGEDNE